MRLPKIILLVDDDDTGLYIIKRLINKHSIETEVLIARNGQEALAIMHELCGQEQCPELILLDIQMPVMDGFEFLAQFRKVAHLHRSSLKIVLLSSSTHPLDLEEAKKYPLIDFLEKPLTQEKLLKLM